MNHQSINIRATLRSLDPRSATNNPALSISRRHFARIPAVLVSSHRHLIIHQSIDIRSTLHLLDQRSVISQLGQQPVSDQQSPFRPKPSTQLLISTPGPALHSLLLGVLWSCSGLALGPFCTRCGIAIVRNSHAPQLPVKSSSLPVSSVGAC